MSQLAPSNKKQTFIGVTLFALILLSLLTLHIYSVFFFDLESDLLWGAVLIVVQTWLFVGVFITAHDAMHGALVPKNQKANDLIGSFLVFLYAGFGWRRLKSAHMDHHASPGTEKDPDFNAKNPTQFWGWYILFFKRYFGLMSFVYVVTVVMIYMFVFKADYFNVVLFYGVPSILSSTQLFYFGTFLPHKTNGSNFVDHHNARTNDYPEWLSLLTCYHFGYHHEHHLYPHEPWWRLPTRRRAEIDKGAPNAG